MANPVETVHLPPIIVLHHIVVLSDLKLPHQVHGWSEAEYILWIQKHQEEREQLDLLEGVVSKQKLEDDKYLKIINEVLVHARHEDESPHV